MHFLGCSSLCYFDLSSKTETVIDAGKDADYIVDGEYQVKLSEDGSSIILKKKLKEAVLIEDFEEAARLRDEINAIKEDGGNKNG